MNNQQMLKNYFRIAWRNVLKHRWHSLINIVGLAVSISTTIILVAIIKHESGFDKFRPDYDRIFRVYSEFSGVFEGFNRGVPGPTGPKIKRDFIGVESATSFMTLSSDVKVRSGDSKIDVFEGQSDIVLADEDYFRTLGGYQWLTANHKQNFIEPYQVVLSENKAKKYFKIKDARDAIGKQLLYFDSVQVTVSGIVKLPEQKSDFYFNDFISLATAKHPSMMGRVDLEHWASTNSNAQLFIKVLPGISPSHIAAQFQPLIDLYNQENDNPNWIYNYRLQPLSNLHFNAQLGIFDSSPWTPASRKTLGILLLTSVILIVIAIINFINLETAKATLRAKDIGIRKTLGSSRISLIAQYFGETSIITLFAILLSLAIADIASRYFVDFLPNGFSLNLLTVFHVYFILILWILVTTLAGLYPALIITKLKATEALSRKSLISKSKSPLRRSLIISQFCIAQLFIAGTLMVTKQINFLQEKNLGFSTTAILNIALPWKSDKAEKVLFVESLRQIPGVETLSVHDETPARNGWSSSTITYHKNDSTKQEVNVFRKFGDSNYIPFYKIELIAGQNYRTSDSLSELIINETYARQLGFDPVASALGINLHFTGKDLPVVGVVRDFNFKSLHNAVEPVALGYSSNYQMVSLKLASTDFNIAGIDRIVGETKANWTTYFPDARFKYEFYDETIAKFYAGERKMSKLLRAVTFLAIIISCLGLFGLVTFMAERRRKEIGIRKVLGATVSELVLLLTKDFVRLILIALIIATPVVWYLARHWLNGFAYRIDISGWLFVLTGILAMIIALLTVGLQSLSAALANPANSLRSE